MCNSCKSPKLSTIIHPVNLCIQEPMSRSMQHDFIPVTAFSKTDLFLDRVYFEWDSRWSAITNH